MKKLATLLALALVAVLTFVSCGSDETSRPDGDSGTASAQYNVADVTFASEMIPHHEQAVQMSRMAESRAQNPDVRKLARDIAAAQGPEIDTMRQWLQDWGQDASEDTDHGDMGHGGSEEMPGMMDADELGRLGNARGDEWDRMFLTMMIDHHEGAIEMAKTEQTEGKDADAIALAEQIEVAQSVEITTMKHLLSS